MAFWYLNPANLPRLFGAFRSSVRVSWRFLDLYQPTTITSSGQSVQLFLPVGGQQQLLCATTFTWRWNSSAAGYYIHRRTRLFQTNKQNVDRLVFFFLLSNGLLPLFDSSGRTGCWRPHQPLINSLDHQSADGHISTVTSQCYALRLRYVSVFLPFLFLFLLLSFSNRLLHTSPPAGTCLSLDLIWFFLSDMRLDLVPPKWIFRVLPYLIY